MSPNANPSPNTAIQHLRQQVNHQHITTSHVAKSQITAMQEIQEANERLSQQAAQIQQLIEIVQFIQQQLTQQATEPSKPQYHHLETPHQAPSLPDDDEYPPLTAQYAALSIAAAPAAAAFETPQRPRVEFVLSYKTNNANYNDLSLSQRRNIIQRVTDIISFTNGIDDDHIMITLKQGSLIVEAAVSMPAGAGEPSLPNPMAIARTV